MSLRKIVDIWLVPIISGVITVMAALYDAFGLDLLTVDADLVFAVGIIVFVVSTLFALILPQVELNKYLRARPRLVLQAPYVETHKIRDLIRTTINLAGGKGDFIENTTSVTSGTLSSVQTDYGDYQFALAKVTNSPTTKTANSIAKNVTAKTDYYTSDGAQINQKDVFCRWWHRPEPAGMDLYIARMTDIPSSNPAILGVAHKPANEACMYAYDVDSHNHSALKKSGLALGKTDRYTHICISGDNFDTQEIWYLISIKNDDLHIEAVGSPEWAKEVSCE